MLLSHLVAVYFLENSIYLKVNSIIGLLIAILISGSKVGEDFYYLSLPKPLLRMFFQQDSGIGKGPNPKGIFRSGWTTTGGITVHSSKVKLRNCVFENSYSEDALNVISSNFLLENSTFRNLPSDGFDGDFVEGTIRNCKFENIGGDGIDFSGTYWKPIRAIFQHKDKAVPVGESSNVKLSYLSISNIKLE